MSLANKFSYLRIALAFVMILFAAKQIVIPMLLVYVLALLTDVIDGAVARKLKEATPYGKRLDIIADNILVLCLIVCFVLVSPEILGKYSYHLAVLLGYFIIVQAISLALTKELIFLRLYSSNLAAILFPFVVLTSIFFENRPLIFAYIIIMFYSLTEKLFLKIARRKGPTIWSSKHRKLKMGFLAMVVFWIIVVVLLPFKQSPVACFGEKCILLEVVSTEESRALGLMNRESIEGGMLFVFEHPGEYSFWMKNMRMSIDMVFIDENNTITDIYPSVVPCAEEPCIQYYPSAPVKYVIEVQSGFCSANNVNPGDNVRIESLDNQE